MRGKPAPKEDSTIGVDAPIPWHVVDVEALPGHRLRVRFADGTAGDVDATSLIFGPQPGVFASLRDPTLFASVRLEHGAVTWLDGIDLAPDAMYDAIKSGGRWRPG